MLYAFGRWALFAFVKIVGNHNPLRKRPKQITVPTVGESYSLLFAIGLARFFRQYSINIILGFSLCVFSFHDMVVDDRVKKGE